MEASQNIADSGDCSCKELIKLLREKGEILHVSPYDPGREVIHYMDTVYKILDKKMTINSCQRMNSLRGEYHILNYLKKFKFVPQDPKFKHDEFFDILSYDYVAGVTLDDSELRLKSARFLKLAFIILKISWVGIIHRDLKSANFILKPDGKLCLIDFDQAVYAGRRDAFHANIFCPSQNRPSVHGSLFTMIKICSKQRPRVHSVMRRLKRYTPAMILDFLRVIKNGNTKNSDLKGAKLPNLHKGASNKLQQLRHAWAIAMDSNASSPGISICYHSLTEGGYSFPGERPWDERWQYLKNAYDYRGCRVLELGCNLALLSIFLLKESGAKAALAVDADYEILCAAQLVAGAYEVSPFLYQLDLDSPSDWEEQLMNFNPDIVFCLNVRNWVKNKARLESFLLQFPVVIFEGHDDDQNELQIFTNNGFAVEKISRSERGRLVFKAVKKGASNTTI